MLLIALTALSCWNATPKQMRTPDLSDLSGVWLGISEDEIYSFRMRLASDGSGDLASLFLDDVVKVVPISSWRLQDRQLTVVISTSETNVLVDRLRGQARTSGLSLVAEGQRWKRRVEFRRESDVQLRLMKLSSAMGHP